MTNYLTIEDVLTIHEIQIDRYGGSLGLRDEKLVDAALSRPRSGYYNDLIEEAAALWESMSQNHPFIDGNKRTAFACMYVFLRFNGVKVVSSPGESYNFINHLYETNSFSFSALESWLRERTRPA